MTDLSDMWVAVAGQPNTGKSTIFSALTGMHQEVGNWPGKTVEKKQGKAPAQQGGYNVVDLPGSYSLYAQSPEENIAVEYLLGSSPDVIVVVASAVSPERTLAYALDVLALGRPVILALNMADMAASNGVSLDVSTVAAGFGVPVVLLSAVRKNGVEPLREAIEQALRRPPAPGRVPEAVFKLLPDPLRRELFQVRDRLISQGIEDGRVLSLLWQILGGGALNPKGEGNSGSGYAAEGAEFLAKAHGASCKHARAMDADGMQSRCSAEQNVEVANHEDCHAVLSALCSEEYRHHFCEARQAWLEKLVGRDSVQALVRRSATVAWDAWLLHPVWGLAAMTGFLLLTLVAGFGVGFPLAGGTAYLFSLPEPYILAWGQEGKPLLAAMTIGVWRGVGAVVVMLPFIVVFYAIFAFLEDVGYMARAAFIMDRAMNRIGLNGKAFVPLLFAIPCNISGVVGCRTIDDPRQRMLTILLVPLVPCTAKIVVMVTLAAWLFTPLSAVLVVLALLAMNMLVLGGISLLAGKIMPPTDSLGGLVMELPHFHKPNPRAIGRYVWRNVLAFLKKASTLIVAFSVLIWFLSYYPTADIGTSLIGQLGRLLQPLGDIMGVDWRFMTALLASGVSKEAVMATIGVLFASTTDQLPEVLRHSVSQASAVAFMCAQSLFIPCVATIGILYSESRSLKILTAMFAYSFILPIVMATIVYHLALLLG